MWDWVRFRWKLSKLLRSERQIDRSFEKDIEKAHKEKKSRAEVERIQDQRSWESQMVDDEISILVTRYLLGRANRKFLPHPSHDEDKGYWKESTQLGARYLTPAGITELRRTIRAEKADASAFLVSILTALTGIIGTLTGLVALLIQYGS